MRKMLTPQARAIGRPAGPAQDDAVDPSDDRMINPSAQRSMSERAGLTVTEVPGSYAIYVSQPTAVAALITQAAAAGRG
jgi:hypothetical protein